LQKKVTPLEREAMSLTDRSVRSAMLESSYSKALTSDTEYDISYKLVRRKAVTIVGATDAMTIINQPTQRGVLTRYPILLLLRPYLSTEDTRHLLKLAGCTDQNRVARVAWGESDHPRRFQGTFSYADASVLSKRSENTLIYSNYPVNF